jgi:hypothetical protein
MICYVTEGKAEGRQGFTRKTRNNIQDFIQSESAAGEYAILAHGTLLPDALAQFVRVFGIRYGEALSPHTQAFVDTRRAAGMARNKYGADLWRITFVYSLRKWKTHVTDLPASI